MTASSTLSHILKMRRNGSDPSQLEPYLLFFENFLQLADFLLDLSTYPFDLAFGF